MNTCCRLMTLATASSLAILPCPITKPSSQASQPPSEKAITLRAPPIKVSAEAESFIQTPQGDKLAVAYVDVDISVMNDVYPASQGWVVHGWRFHSPVHGWLYLHMDEARKDDLSLCVAWIPEGESVVDVVAAYRFVITAQPQYACEGEIALAHVDGSRLVEVSRTILPSWSVPTAKAVSDKWGDFSVGIGKGGRMNLALAKEETVGGVSWNGAESGILAEVKHPSYHGFYNLVTMMDDATLSRTKGALSEWPEPVLFFRAKFLTGL